MKDRLRMPLRQKPRGVALIEALVALLVMAFGMVAIAGLMTTMRRSADVAKQRGEALRIAQKQMETWRDFSVLSSPTADQRDYTDKVSTDIPAALLTLDNASYSLTPQMTKAAADVYRGISMKVEWTDRAGDTQRVYTDSVIARADPSLAGALSVAPAYTATQRPPDGTPSLPPAAKDLGGGKSVLIPQPGGSVAWVFNNISGVITSVCTITAGTPIVNIHTIADLTSCSNNTLAFALWGYVSFASGTPLPTPLSYSYAIPIGLAVTQSGTVTTPAQCLSNAPGDAAGPQMVVAYTCIVYPGAVSVPDPAHAGQFNAITAWSGELDITNLTLGTGNWKVCRYSGDYDGDGTISNAEHPLVYDKVQGALGNQNFLVIKYSETCPTGASTDTGTAFWSKATVQHQPNGVVTPTTAH